MCSLQMQPATNFEQLPTGAHLSAGEPTQQGIHAAVHDQVGCESWRGGSLTQNGGVGCRCLVPTVCLRSTYDWAVAGALLLV